MSRCSTRAGAKAKPPECQQMEVQFKDSLSWERAFTEKILSQNAWLESSTPQRDWDGRRFGKTVTHRHTVGPSC